MMCYKVMDGVITIQILECLEVKNNVLNRKMFLVCYQKLNYRYIDYVFPCKNILIIAQANCI